MKIDLIYNYRSLDTKYIIYGPEKVGNNIEISTSGYIVNSISEVINKINDMIASLAPDIINCESISSGLYGNMYMSIIRGDINAGSEVPDYTDILTSINTNLTNLNDKFISSNNNVAYLLESLFLCFNRGLVSENSNDKIKNSFLCQALFYRGQPYSDNGIANYLRSILSSLKQSVSPNANITDVISALNTNIHNDLTEINTTTDNKDTVLIVDGQQDFVIRKQNIDD